MKKIIFPVKLQLAYCFLPFAFLIFALSLLPSGISAQVRFKISTLGDGETYLVSALPERSFIGLENTTGSVQISLRVPSSAHFTAGKITSLQSDVKWIDNVYVEKPEGDANHNYMSFALVSTGTKSLNYQQGQELPLFTFKNIGAGCSGKIELVNTDDVLTQNVIANGINIGNHITILGSKGESYAGLVSNSSSVTCDASLTGVNTPNETAMVLYPVPAKTTVNAEWNSSTHIINASLEVINPKGESVYFQKIGDGQTTHSVDVQSFPTGIYTMRLQSGNTALANKSFVITH